MVEVGVQRERPRPTLNIEPKVCGPLLLLSLQMFIQIKYIYKEQQRQPCRGKSILQGQTEQHITDGRGRRSRM